MTTIVDLVVAATLHLVDHPLYLPAYMLVQVVACGRTVLTCPPICCVEPAVLRMQRATNLESL